jgi:hypothetical protein
MFKVGDTVKWMCPLDHDYFYGEIVSIAERIATIKGIGLYQHITADVHFKYIKKVAGGRCGGSGKRDN